MAKSNANPLLAGLSGMIGKAIVIRTVRGKIIISNRPRSPKKQSEQQRENRLKFKMASRQAKLTMMDPAKKSYYTQQAMILNLPNAYTAALKEFIVERA